MYNFFPLVSVLASFSLKKIFKVAKKSPLIRDRSQIKHTVIWEAIMALLNLKEGAKEGLFEEIAPS